MDLCVSAVLCPLQLDGDLYLLVSDLLHVIRAFTSRSVNSEAAPRHDSPSLCAGVTLLVSRLVWVRRGHFKGINLAHSSRPAADITLNSVLRSLTGLQLLLLRCNRTCVNADCSPFHRIKHFYLISKDKILVWQQSQIWWVHPEKPPMLIMTFRSQSASLKLTFCLYHHNFDYLFASVTTW